MMGTFFALLLAALLYFYPLPEELSSQLSSFSPWLFIIALFFPLILLILQALTWTPLQKAEQSSTPQIFTTLKADHNLKIAPYVLLFFVFFSLFAAINLTVLHLFNPAFVLMIWIVLFGISLDVFFHHTKHLTNFLDPFYVVDRFTGSAEDSIRASDEAKLCQWIDALAETALKAIDQNSQSLALLVMDKLLHLSNEYLTMAKGISYHTDEDTNKMGAADHVSYTLFYLFQRIELIFDKALEKRLEPVCSKGITSLGKISLYGAKYDITLASYPVHYIGKLTKKAQETKLTEVANRATATLIEVSKAIIKEVDLQYVEIKDVFLSVIDKMHEIAKNTFRADKKINIGLLTQPFYDLRQLFQSEKIADHQDTPVILQSIDAVINEFSTLEQVMGTMPTPSEILKEKEESFDSDEPAPPTGPTTEGYPA